MDSRINPALAVEAKALVALAFRNGPIEEIHAGTPCTTCAERQEYSHISDDEMKRIMKSAVNTLYRLLWQRDNDPAAFRASLALGERYTRFWDDPEINRSQQRPIDHKGAP